MKLEYKHYFFEKIGAVHVLVWRPEKLQDLLPGILFLHGAGERGQDPEQLRTQGLPRYLSEGREIPAVVICPQCPEGMVWDNLLFQLDEILEDLVEHYPVDKSRLSLTGLSMGGFGTWSHAIARSRRFFRIAPICGGGMSWQAEALRNTPVWAFHGGADDDVPPVYSQLMVEALRAQGGDAVLTVYPGVGHNSWDRAYLTSGLIPWLLGEDVARQ